MGWGVPVARRQCYNSPMNSDLSGRPRPRPRPRAKMPILGRTLDRGPTKTTLKHEICSVDQLLFQQDQISNIYHFVNSSTWRAQLPFPLLLFLRMFLFDWSENYWFSIMWGRLATWSCRLWLLSCSSRRPFLSTADWARSLAYSVASFYYKGWALDQRLRVINSWNLIFGS